jgi:hypothetical protein
MLVRVFNRIIANKNNGTNNYKNISYLNFIKRNDSLI